MLYWLLLLSAVATGGGRLRLGGQYGPVLGWNLDPKDTTQALGSDTTLSISD